MRKILVFATLISLLAASCTKSSLNPNLPGTSSNGNGDDNPHNSNGDGDDNPGSSNGSSGNGSFNGVEDNPNASNGDGDDD